MDEYHGPPLFFIIAFCVVGIIIAAGFCFVFGTIIYRCIKTRGHVRFQQPGKIFRPRGAMADRGGNMGFSHNNYNYGGRPTAPPLHQVTILSTDASNSPLTPHNPASDSH